MPFNMMKLRRQRSSATVTTTSTGHEEHEEHGEHDESHAEGPSHKPIPFLASPVDPEAMKWLAKKKRTGAGVERATTVAAFDSEKNQTESALGKRIFRKQHEASSLELFFDLFFVANLAVFTTLSAHVDLQSLSNYIGFFAILWTTWFHICIYDVRFYVDSIFTRILKFFFFGAMVSLVGLTSMYTAVLTNGSSRAFHGIAILMCICRVLFIVQHAIVLYFVRAFDKTLIPLVLTMLIYLLSAIGFLATWIIDRNTPALQGMAGAEHVRYWYIIMSIEAVLVIGVSSIWRVLSFRHTHLVERVGLLSLIIMGEGIIGLVKSTAYSIQGASVSLTAETGIVAAGVLLIYLIYILYFDNIDHHRFGTIRQQIWTLLHFPLHISILLTVEGSTALLLWNSCRNAIAQITEDRMPSLQNPKGKFNDLTAWTANLQDTYNWAKEKYHYKDLTDYYKTDAFASDLAKLSKPKAAFGTADWSTEVTPTLTKMKNYYEYFVYQNFGAEGPYKIKKEPDYGKKVQLYEDGFKFVTMYFFCAAGALLFVLAFLYWFGRRKSTKSEWVAIGIRLFAGMCLPLAIISPLTEAKNAPLDNTFRFEFSYLLIPVVTFGYLLVVVVDNVVKAIANKHYTIVEQRRISRMTSFGTADGKPMLSPREEEVIELTEEDSSYERHRNSSPEHGSPQVVNPYSPQGQVRFQDMATGNTGYSQVEQEDSEVPPQYRDNAGPNRFSSMRKM